MEEGTKLRKETEGEKQVFKAECGLVVVFSWCHLLFSNLYICVYTFIDLYIYICLHVHMFTCTYICIYTHMLLYVAYDSSVLLP